MDAQGHFRPHKKIRKFGKTFQISSFQNVESWKIGKFGKHACAVATPRGCTDGAQMAMEIRITQPESGPEVLVYSYLDGFCVRLILRTRYAPGSTDIYCGGIGIFYLRDSCGPQSLQGVQSIPRHKIINSYRGRSLKDRIVTIVSLTRVLVFGLVVLASSLPLYGKVPRLILKKTNRLTQALVFSRRYSLCGALMWNCSSAKHEGPSTYVQRECSAEPFIRSILCHKGSLHLSPVLAYDFLSRSKFSLRTNLCTGKGSTRRTLCSKSFIRRAWRSIYTCTTEMFSRTLYA